MCAAFSDRPLPDLLDRLGTDAEGPLTFVNPSGIMLSAFIDWAIEHPETCPRVRILAEEWTLKQTLDEFTVATKAAELVENAEFGLRYVSSPPKTAMAIDGESVFVLVDGESVHGMFTGGSSAFVSELTTAVAARYEEAEAYDLHTPPISRITETLASRFGEDREAAFRGMMDAMVDADSVDEVVVSLLVAARFNDLLYDISKWGEDIGLASKATFSRKKSQLEGVGLLETEKEPIDVGRPRLRLRFGDPWLAEAPPADVVAETRELLA